MDVFRGWVSAIGKAVTAREAITRTVKITNIGRPSLAEEQGDITPVTGITVTPPTGNVAKGQNITLTVAVQPEGATDKTFRATSANQNFATITVKGNTITVKGIAAGKAQIPVVTGNGEFAAVAEGPPSRMALQAEREIKHVSETKQFEYNGVSVTLSELSALQRIEHLALLKRRAEEAEVSGNLQVSVEDLVRTGAFLVAMSLWHNHPQKKRSHRQ